MADQRCGVAGETDLQNLGSYPRPTARAARFEQNTLGDSRTHDGGLKNLVDFDPRHLVLSLRLSVPILSLA